ncbi:MAG: mechanosensitive ion channel [Akkermansiaceae bacterium]|nr:mechanosensitive ion channel [Akkermansiaceae bacterium]MDP4898345.1 mechanosensitive ion channel [Akkermansiaceae bacterium]
MISRFFSLAFILFVSASPFALAQDAESPATSTASDPAIDKDILALSLDPLTKDELSIEVAAWVDVLEEKSKEISQAEIKILKNEGDEKAIRADLIKLREEKSDIITRARIAVEAFEVKGGDVEEYNKYIAAVIGIDPEANDLATRWNTLNRWLQSEDGGIKWLVNSLKFIFVMVVFWFISYFATKLIRRTLEKQIHISALLKVFINKMSRRAILLIGLVVALGTVGVNVGAALALIGGGAFILAFALQDTLGNFAAGLMLIIYRPFDVGNAVEVGGVTGNVDSVSLVSTVIRTFDNKKVIVPNKKVWGEVITNITGMPTRRVDMIFGIGYGDDTEKAQEILERIVSENELVLDEPEPAIHLHELADSSVNFICRPWAATADHWTVYWEITKRVKKEFDAAGISIPYPQSDVHLHIPEGTKLPAPKP